jgi:hypothetical protein
MIERNVPALGTSDQHGRSERNGKIRNETNGKTFGVYLTEDKGAISARFGLSCFLADTFNEVRVVMILLSLAMSVCVSLSARDRR